MRPEDIGKIVIGIAVLIFYLIKKATKASTPVNKFNQAPPQKFNDPFQQNTFNQIPGKTQQQNSGKQKPNFQNTFTSAENFNPMGNNPQPQSTSVYCMYCGKKFSNIKMLEMDTCFKHPKSEMGLQKHVLYRGMGRPNVTF